MIKLSPNGEAVLRRAMTNIELDPMAWNQATWACETTACLAGHILMEEKDISFREVAQLCDPGMDAIGLLGLEAFTHEATTFYNDVFGFIQSGNVTLRGDRYNSMIALKTFKERITNLTGIEL